MIGVTSQVRIYGWCEPADMLRGFEGLSGMVRNELGHDPLDGSLFLFVNRRRTHTKILHLDGTGLCVFAKRLERGRFVALWNIAKHSSLQLSKGELDLFLQGSTFVARFRLAPESMTDKELEVRSSM